MVAMSEAGRLEASASALNGVDAAIGKRIRFLPFGKHLAEPDRGAKRWVGLGFGYVPGSVIMEAAPTLGEPDYGRASKLEGRSGVESVLNHSISQHFLNRLTYTLYRMKTIFDIVTIRSRFLAHRRSVYGHKSTNVLHQN